MMRSTTSWLYELRPVLWRLKIFLSTPTAGFFILFIAVAARIIQLVFFYNIIVDASYQVLATENFVHGHGLSIGAVNPRNLSEINYRPLLNWPPGYSLLLTPFYLLFDCHYIPAGIALDVIMGFVFLLVCRKILKLLSLPAYLVNVCTLVNGFFVYYFYFIASSDGIAIPFFLIGIYYALKLLQKNGKPVFNTLLMFTGLGAAAFLKYLFMPIVFSVPLYLLAIGFINKNKILKRAGFFSFVALLVFVGCFLVYQIGISGSAGYVSAPGRGLFPRHLLDTYPFVPGSFMKPDTVGVFLGVATDHYSFSYIAWQIINVVLVVFLFYFLFYFVKKKGWQQLSPASHFFHICFLLSLLVFQVLAILSLQVEKEEILPGWFWTYVEEARYYGLVTVLFHLAAFVFYRFAMPKISGFITGVFWLMILLLGIEVGRGLFFTLNRIRHFGKEEYSWQQEERFQQYAETVVKKARLLYGNTPVIVGGSSYYYSHRVGLNSHIPVLYAVPVALNPSIAKTTKPVVLINMVNKKTTPAQTMALLTNEKIAGRFGDFLFYIIYVVPAASNF